MKRALCLIGLCLLVSSCSRLDWALRWADTYIMWEADGLFDLSSEQKREFRPQVQQALGDVKRTVLPLASDLMDEIEGDLRKSPTEDLVDAWFRKSRAIAREGLHRFEPVALAFARRATPAQDEYFARKFRQRLEDKRRDVATPEKTLKADLKRMKSWFDFFGVSLNTAQKKSLENFLRANPTPYEIQLRQRERLLADFLKTNGETRQSWIRRFSADPESFRSPEEARILDARESALRGFLRELLKNLDDKQKKDLRQTLKEKAAEIRRLSQS